MSEKEVVLTMYGKGSLLEDISITLFEREEKYYYRDDKFIKPPKLQVMPILLQPAKR